MSSYGEIQRGYFLIADICGYTEFFTGVELDHAAAILRELMASVLSHVRAPFRLAKLEGDAVFYYAPDDAFEEGDRLLDHIEACYEDFIGGLEGVQHETTCPCQACQSVHRLGLKFFAHHGQAVVQRFPGAEDEIVGPDIILLHRLLKNRVTEVTGLTAYALLTDACLERTGRPRTLVEHTETYEHLGEVRCGAYDLRHALEARRSARRVYLEREESDCVHEAVLRATPQQLWPYVIEPNRRLAWMRNLRSVVNHRGSEGRFGVGSEAHCAHGTFFRLSRFVDFRPCHYYTIYCEHEPSWVRPPFYSQFELTPVDAEHTRISFRMRTTKRDPLTVFLTRHIGTWLTRYEIDYQRLARALEQEAAEALTPAPADPAPTT